MFYKIRYFKSRNDLDVKVSYEWVFSSSLGGMLLLQCFVAAKLLVHLAWPELRYACYKPWHSFIFQVFLDRNGFVQTLLGCYW